LLPAVALQRVMDNGVIPVRLEENAVRFRVARLYASSASGFRELYANELRACRIAKEKYGASPRIEITVNENDRTLTIHGVDSLGITEEKFLSTLSVLGETDNQDGSEIGQFGWGIAAFGTLSDSIMYETYARETGEKYAFLGIAGEHFSKLPQPTLDLLGTRVTVFLREDVNLFNLEDNIRNVCAYADIETFMTVIDASDEAFPSKVPQPQRISDPDITRNLPYGTLVEVDDEDFKLVGVLTPLPANQPHVDLRLLCMPIQADLKFPFDSCVLQIKDERKYRPTADRERLTEEATGKLSARIREKLSKTLPQVLDIYSFEDFRQKPCKYIYFQLHYQGFVFGLHERGERQPLREVYTPSERTCKLSKLLDLPVRMLNFEGWREERLGDVITVSRNPFLVDSLDGKLQETLRVRYPDALLFVLSKKPRHKYLFDADTIAALLEQEVRTDADAEAEDIRSELASEKHPAPRRQKLVDEASCSVIVHTSRIRRVEECGRVYDRLADRTEETRLCDVAEDTIFVPNIEKYLPILMEVYSNRGLSRLDKLPKTLKNRRLTLNRFLEQQANHQVTTNRGTHTFKALLKSHELIRILIYSDARIAAKYDGKETFLPMKGQEAFELAVYLRANGKDYVIEHVPTEEEFKKATGMDRWDYGYREKDYNSTVNATVNTVYHVGLAVKDERLRRLFFAAAKSLDAEAPLLRQLLNFSLESDQRLPKLQLPA